MAESNKMYVIPDKNYEFLKRFPGKYKVILSANDDTMLYRFMLIPASLSKLVGEVSDFFIEASKEGANNELLLTKLKEMQDTLVEASYLCAIAPEVISVEDPESKHN